METKHTAPSPEARVMKQETRAFAGLSSPASVWLIAAAIALSIVYGIFQYLSTQPVDHGAARIPWRKQASSSSRRNRASKSIRRSKYSNCMPRRTVFFRPTAGLTRRPEWSGFRSIAPSISNCSVGSRCGKRLAKK